MPGLKILFRLVDVGYHDPTKIYDIVEDEKGDLQIRKIFDHHDVSLHGLVRLIDQQEIRRPVVLTDPHPQIMEEFKQKGIRVR